MFGIGFSEMITLIIVMLILINPKDFPRLVHRIGKVYGKINRELREMKKVYGEFEKEVNTSMDLDITGKQEARKSITHKVKGGLRR